LENHDLQSKWFIHQSEWQVHQELLNKWFISQLPNKFSLKEKLKFYKWESANFIMKRIWLKQKWTKWTSGYSTKITSSNKNSINSHQIKTSDLSATLMVWLKQFPVKKFMKIMKCKQSNCVLLVLKKPLPLYFK